MARHRRFLIYLAIGIGSAIVTVFVNQRSHSFFDVVLAYFAICVGLFVFVMYVNFACLVIGLSLRFTFCALSFDPLTIRREASGIRIRRVRSSLGITALTLPTDERNLVQRLCILDVVPLAASFIAMLFAASGAFVLYTGGSNRWICLVLLVIAVTALLACVLSCLPSRTGPKQYALAHVAFLRVGGPDVEKACAQTVLAGQMYAGVRPRDWDARFLEAAVPQDVVPDDVRWLLYRYYHAFDSGDVATADSVMRRMLALLDSTNRSAADPILAEAAFFYAMAFQDAATARGCATHIRWKQLKMRTRLRVEAAILLAEGRSTEAWSSATQALASREPKWPAGYAIAEDDWIAAIMGRAAGVAPQAPVVSASA